MGLSLKKFNLDFRKVEKVDDQRMARQNNQVNPDIKHAYPREKLLCFCKEMTQKSRSNCALCFITFWNVSLRRLLKCVICHSLFSTMCSW